jgi:hypothetical protein
MVSPQTLYLARFIGVGLALMCAALAARPRWALEAIGTMMGQPGVMLVTGVMTLVAGAALVIGHNLWTGGYIPIAVTAIGWLTLIKGFAILVLPAPVLGRLYAVLGYPRTFRLVMIAGCVFGAQLAFVAFRAAPSLSV